ncbi:zinc finger CCCH domain-containing protein 18 isoform X3 [Pieris napi]|uniref:zinc finger CCCH domain-containing protein 18 isoform X3 n=1 Tax=Pieris napi TaxID=78633 RepID=UPI001FBA595D|nr:zinc finger CCCH domain-containing protein 18 isoform X3 [Pieris napi]
MDSEDSRDAGDTQSTSSSSSSSSKSRSRRSSSSGSSKRDTKSPPHSPTPSKNCEPRSPSPNSRSPSPERSLSNKPQTPDNLSGAHSDINSPENSAPASPAGPKSPDAPKSPSDVGSNIDSPERPEQYSSGPKTPQSSSSAKSVTRSQPVSPDSASQATSRNNESQPRSSSPSPDRTSLSPQRPVVSNNEWENKDKWRRHTKAEQKMVSVPRERSQSESSQSSRSSTYNKRTNAKDTEEISDGEMESDQEDRKSEASNKLESKEKSISHEDLSDVSDLDLADEKTSKPKSKKPEIANGEPSPRYEKDKETHKMDKAPLEKISNTEDAEEQLDFEAEEGECVEPKSKDHSNGDIDDQAAEKEEELKPGKRSRGSSLEEGEVSDEAERRPEESEPKPVCRFFSRGACTWGVSCRFLHPGVTDKGNYNMFEVVRGVPAGGYPATPRDVAPPESAWERGLRTAKEMLRIANKRKEQDMDFEEKKLHLSVGGVVHDPDADLAYAAAAVGASPPPIHEAPPPRDTEAYRGGYGVPPFRGRLPRGPVDERERYYERERGFERERTFERPPYFEEYGVPPDDPSHHKRRVRASREVIVQRAEVERREGREGRERRERDGRGDEWADPWMRAEPAAKKRRAPSSDSYSSSRLSPSVIVRERRLANARATAMNPPAPRRRAPSPAAARQLAANPPAPPSHRHKDEPDPYNRGKAASRNRNRKKYSRSSSSGSESSTSSSDSESESHSSSSSGSSGARRARHARLINAAARPRLNAKSTGLAAAVTVANKKEASSENETGRKRAATSPVGAGAAKKSVSRREELLKQLKAVEDAIARKRSKI